jgi:hypothetical protein
VIINPYSFGNGGSYSGWTPADLAVPPAAWFNDDSSVIESAGLCEQIFDWRSNGISMSQSTSGDRPTLNSSGLNSRRTLELQSNDFMVSTSMQAMSNATPFVGIFAVYQNRSSSADVRTLLGFSTNGAAVRCALQTSRTSNTDKPTLGVRRLDGDSFTSLSGTSTGTSWCLAGARMNYTNGDGFVDVNGVLGDAFNGTLTSSGSTSATNSAYVRLGTGSGVTPAAPWADVNIAELFVIVGTMPADADLDRINGYFAHRWGLTSVLDGAHPYKTTPP